MQEKIQKWMSQKELEKKEAESAYKKQLLEKAGLIQKTYLKKWQPEAKYDTKKGLYYFEDDVDLDSISDDDYKKIEEYLKTNKTVDEGKNDEKDAGFVFGLIGVLFIFIGFILAVSKSMVYGLVVAISSIPFFAIQKIINLLIDIYNKMK